MELWVRSQDREKLRKIIDFKYQKGTLETYDDVIVGTTQYDEWEVLGKYKSKERALEVLDEIQNKICPQDCINIGYGTIVYEMPKE